MRMEGRRSNGGQVSIRGAERRITIAVLAPQIDEAGIEVGREEIGVVKNFKKKRNVGFDAFDPVLA